MATNYFNFELSPDATPLGGDFVAWLNTEAVRAAIHVGSRSYAPANSTVEAHLKPDWMRDVVGMLVPLMENYKVVIYNGQTPCCAQAGHLSSSFLPLFGFLHFKEGISCKEGKT